MKRPQRPGWRGRLTCRCVEEWAKEKSRTSWVPKTEHEHRVWMGHFIATVGDRRLASYTKSDGRTFKSILLKLPANWNKYDELKALPVDKAAERAEEIGLAPMSESNVNKLLGFVSSFWTWAENNYDDSPPNPFKGLKIKRQRNPRAERDPFTDDELRAIFSGPIYTGCKSVRQWKEPGDLVPRDAGIFWVPLIGLFSGARLGEIVQLYTSDVREEGGIRFFDINDAGEDKRLKNGNAARQIPLHPTLIFLGLLDHVQLRRDEGPTRFFPDLHMGEDSYYSSPFSKHFSRVLSAAGVKRRKNAFHSFRHSFEDACRNSGISKEVMDALQGHGERGKAARYGRGYMLETLAGAMERLHYRNLDLSHLCCGAG
ncbi:MAG: site-specific integrase [Rhodovibrionaceae bacterium]